jgi:hypothetical protein
MDGFELMLLGMAIVFSFLIILVAYMKLVPKLSEFFKHLKSKLRSSGSRTGTILGNPHNTSYTNNPGTEGNPTKLNSVLGQISDNPSSSGSGTVPPLIVAAIAAAIYSHTGKKPKHLAITPLGGYREPFNLWGVAGREDLMAARDITGQVGFQY